MYAVRSLFNALTMTAALLASIVRVHSAERQYPTLPFSSDIGGSFKLTDHMGRVVTDKGFRGQYVILGRTCQVTRLALLGNWNFRILEFWATPHAPVAQLDRVTGFEPCHPSHFLLLLCYVYQEG
jgi:hypothetical protein